VVNFQLIARAPASRRLHPTRPGSAPIRPRLRRAEL